MTPETFRSWQLRTINGCLAAVVLFALAPQYWPSLALVSGVAAVVCGIVALVAYFIRPSDDGTEDFEKQRDRSSDVQGEPASATAIVEEVVTIAALKRRTPEQLYDLYGSYLKEHRKEDLLLALTMDVAKVRQGWSKLVEVEPQIRSGTVRAVYNVSGSKIRRKEPRSRSATIELMDIAPRSRSVH